tara:strand:- start:515 stop:1657 length:1143 start_codon:yes stop_codon:yes gene_type:complete
MAEPTSTRAALRQEIARRTNMDFALRIGASSTATDGGTNELIDTNRLRQADDFWNGAWLYIVNDTSGTDNDGEVRLISDFTSDTRSIAVVEPFSAAIANTDEYEIHSPWNALQIHDAINDAIDDGFPEFFDTVIDETVVHLEDTMAYDLPTGIAPYYVTKVWIEEVSDKSRGTASSGSSTTLVDSTQSWTNDAFNNMTVAIYDGTGKGQFATITDTTAGTTLTVAAWSGTGTTSPSTDSKYVIKDTPTEQYTWRRIPSLRFDQAYWPTKMYLTSRYTRFQGMAFRIQYIAKPPSLSAESGTTIIPSGFVIAKAMALLHGMKVADSRSDQDRHRYLHQFWESRSEAYKLQNKWRMPKGTLWMEKDTVGDQLPSDYPFSSSG